MNRTVLAIWTEPPTGDTTIESDHANASSGVEVDMTQETLDGPTVYSGRAAHMGYEEREVLVPGEDGLYEAERQIENPKDCEWFAVPDSNPGYACFGSSDADYIRSSLALQAGGYLDYANYDLTGIVDAFESESTSWWQVLWSEDSSSGESGAFYPAADDSGDSLAERIRDRGLRSNITQVGFETAFSGTFMFGTIAASGYCELYTPSELSAAKMAGFVGERLLPHAFVPDVDSSPAPEGVALGVDHPAAVATDGGEE